ncbi:hypothetical protein ACFLRW_02260 [Acidobacteriota bacterium]
MEREEINKHFERLHEALKSVDLPTEHEGTRQGVHAGEFMLMSSDEWGNIKFKHSVTRNYIVLCSDNSVYIPTGGAFRLGYFDSCLGMS